MRRPLWFGAGVAVGAGGTLWVELRLRRWGRRAAALLAPLLAGDGARRSEAGARGSAPTRVPPAPARLGRTVRRAALRGVTSGGVKLARAAARAAVASREGSAGHR